MKGEALSTNASQTAGFEAMVGGGVAAPVAAAGVVDDVTSAPSYMPPRSDEPKRRTLLMQAFVDTFTQRGARLGAIWIAIVVFLAVFAPFLASSFPIAMQTSDGRWSFPLFRNLYPIDVVLVVVFAAAL